ncbi:hypothetical protein MKK75_23245 [Methylobacterium sp. J-030]|uniref:hypothetical protein n=1 Tax=Methylobacterium sp. J-030 TaxID=2836627 RepID=UPI001FBA949A|nr:hypothetical protein [Methylobacterium sp. J-030]MCJ2071681.1 hypothetical protein [Methylobacterium sp. J-030]
MAIGRRAERQDGNRSAHGLGAFRQPPGALPRHSVPNFGSNDDACRDLGCTLYHNSGNALFLAVPDQIGEDVGVEEISGVVT